MTDLEFLGYKYMVLNYCPRGEAYFCDGTPNLSAEGDTAREKINPCPHRQDGKCTYLENLDKGQVCDYDCEGMAGTGI